jgi:tetratricopeptide (TPR) repeat protein
MQKLLDRLEHGIAHGRIPNEIPFLRAERAVLLIRMGEFERARKELVALRALPEAQSNAVLNAWLWLGEGLADFFESVEARARDRVLRACALAASAKAPRIRALTAAWCAHLDFRAQDYAAMLTHLSEALTYADAEHHGALGRTCVVVAGAYHFAGREDLAQPWYARARTHAAVEGDGVTLSSIMYNMAALRVCAVRLAEFYGEVAGQLDAQAVQRALLGTESSAFLDRSVQAGALSAASAMVRAQALVAHGQHADALALYDSHWDAAMQSGLEASEALFQSDRAWCLYQLGRSDAARNVARSAASALMWASEIEERAVAHAILARTFAAIGLDEQAASHRERGQHEWSLHRQRCDSLLTALQQAGLESLPGPRH